jgi:hypothetical protein
MVAEAPDAQGVVRLDDLDKLLGQLVDRVRPQGLRLTGEGGLLGELTKMIVESVAEGEMDVTSATPSTTRPAVMAATPATARGPRPCSPTSGRSRSRSRGIATAASSRRSCASANVGCPASTGW